MNLQLIKNKKLTLSYLLATIFMIIKCTEYSIDLQSLVNQD
jgi:hypothetical protein